MTTQPPADPTTDPNQWSLTVEFAALIRALRGLVEAATAQIAGPLSTVGKDKRAGK